MECSCRLWPTPGMYVVTSIEFVKRTRATLRSAEFGFFGVCVYTRMHTPRFSGQPANAGDFVLVRIPSRPIRTSCENVGTVFPLLSCPSSRNPSPSVVILRLRRSCVVAEGSQRGQPHARWTRKCAHEFSRRSLRAQTTAASAHYAER